MKTYQAASLDEIAQQFERHAEYERKIVGDKSYPKYRQQLASARSNVWLESG